MTQTLAAPVTGRKKADVDRLWREFVDAMTRAYKSAGHDAPQTALRDYARDISWTDGLGRLEKEEQANERQHRGTRREMYRLSVPHATRVILLHQAARGAVMTEAPPATDFLVFRRTAVEAQLLGWLARAELSAEWIATCDALDYAALV